LATGSTTGSGSVERFGKEVEWHWTPPIILTDETRSMVSDLTDLRPGSLTRTVSDAPPIKPINAAPQTDLLADGLRELDTSAGWWVIAWR